ncbi:MAG TPA: serine/threonine-protein kinase [Thermoanaerobaculia bacterium]|nr:serine/threonine-protein kinase [Thermoanaerobaculia bacterium]
MSTAPDDRTLVRPAEETPTIVVPGDASAAAPAAPLTPGTILGQRYRIVSLLGKGGMGEVYRADDLRLRQPVALKFLSARAAGHERELHDEARIGRQISHPNVCRLYDIAEVDGRIFITMEYVDGEDLASLLRRVGRFAHDKAVSLARDICAGLAAAHELGVVHRDLKPGNIMIDGRGRARVTDFGLAVAAGERERSIAGTPAYMAPEQLAGEPASVHSDIYALGLVLYEIFTGRRVFGGTSISAIIEQQREHRIPAAEDVPPDVERLIFRCLENDPIERPRSVREILGALPHYDALDAAVAAGDTPSPAMVAAAESRGDLSARAAWSLLIAALAGITAATFLSSSTVIVSRPSVKPPEVAREIVRSIVAAAGVNAPIADEGLSYLRDETGLHIAYRQSPRALLPQRVSHIVTPADPPLDVSGMTSVVLDEHGRLRELVVVPPQRDDEIARAPVDWMKLAAFTGIDVTRLTPTKPIWAAPVDTDAKQAWIERGTNRRIEAASYHGAPVWLASIEPNREPERMVVKRAAAANRVARAIFLLLVFALPTVLLFTAWRNLRRGQGDRKGALRLTLFTLSVLLPSSMLYMHHSSDTYQEWLAVSQMVANDAFWALQVWIFYVAIEPLVRRRWPRMLIGWSRIADGRWRDPMVGRDALIGVAAGAFNAVLVQVTALAPGADPLLGVASPLGGARYAAAWLLTYSFQAIFMSLAATALLLVVRALVRRDDLAIVISVLFVAGNAIGDAAGPLAARAAYGIAIGAIVYVILLRFGVLALVATGYTTLVFRALPLTFDVSSWLFNRALIPLALFVAIAIIGFRVSLGGKRWLPRVALD